MCVGFFVYLWTNSDKALEEVDVGQLDIKSFWHSLTKPHSYSAKQAMSRRFFAPEVVLVVGLALAISLNAASAAQWSESLDFNCPKGEVIATVHSVYDQAKQDRSWTFTCKAAPHGSNPRDCRWNQNLCLTNSAMTGVYSFYSYVIRDRTVMYECCTETGYKTDSCSFTPDLNDWHGELNFEVPTGHVILGWFKTTLESQKDTLNKFLVCSYGPE
ncbi:hypothetical protein RRG08_000261 [Elysia crispata]|uniref:Dermatopontin n=1 Tax=Elysia crispata TaxID=231223 RepID=A0AAE0Y9R6_9GAST|nr:hypothetical protein RRG08_000261 [Elysia crispata]